MTSQSPDYFDAFAASWEQNYADPVFQDRLRVYRDWLAPQAGGGDDAIAARSQQGDGHRADATGRASDEHLAAIRRESLRF